ncbi:uncharacterized protein N0V89_004770 [Didymosphaeria variabile]|uniref:Uncharacterized protein n=1 Tax=Didymosphaeria variabile TaxID=1932322 RepID=A0A9W8XQH8_9PLEO|nr:uncharacterized protein N0V89_004770 [Didymosphaeria variabile]KAJ4356734.1 hypothetical protein N0V89_004770 [Didymosphaeria variabile]
MPQGYPNAVASPADPSPSGLNPDKLQPLGATSPGSSGASSSSEESSSQAPFRPKEVFPDDEESEPLLPSQPDDESGSSSGEPSSQAPAESSELSPPEDEESKAALLEDRYVRSSDEDVDPNDDSWPSSESDDTQTLENMDPNDGPTLPKNVESARGLPERLTGTTAAMEKIAIAQGSSYAGGPSSRRQQQQPPEGSSGKGKAKVEEPPSSDGETDDEDDS